MRKLITATMTLWMISAVVSAAGPAFPGPRPGVARVLVENNRIVLENDFLAVRWDLTDGLRLAEAVDKSNSATWPLGPSECLQLLVHESPLPTPQLLLGSQLQRVGQPIVTNTTVDHTAGRRSRTYPGKQVVVQLIDAGKNLTIRWRASLRDEANYVRQSVELIAGADWVELDEVTLLDLPASEATVFGTVDGSPAVAGRWFMGLEHPMSKTELVADSADAGKAEVQRVRCSYRFTPPLAPGTQQHYSAVLGLAPEGQLRRGFLYYLERERAYPYRPFLHNNVGEDAGHIYSTLGKKDRAALAKFRQEQDIWWRQVIEQWGQKFVRDHSVVMDCFVHDYLWDDESKIWQFHEGFGQGFTGPRQEAEKYGATLGVWLTPWARTGGIGRVQAGPGLGFETNFGLDFWGDPGRQHGLSLVGPRYFGRFRATCVNMVRRYGVGYFKFDGFGAGNVVSGAGPYVSEVAALLRVISELRSLKPDVFINATTGTWSSPFWLLWVDSIWRQGLDVGTLGKGSSRQQWLTYRDSETYHNGLVRGPFYPLSSYMLHGIEVNLNSTGEGRTRVVGLKTEDMVDEIRSFFGTGTNCQELYITPEMMTPHLWEVLAEAAKWSRTNQHVLLDTHWVGGDPSKHQIYGWASWSSRKGILTLRNPDDQAGTLELDIAEAFELPPGSPQSYRLSSPWRDHAQKPVIELTAGRPHRFELKPFEVLVFDAMPF